MIFQLSGIWSLWYDNFDDLEDEEIERIVTLPSTTTAAKVSNYVSLIISL